MFGALKPAFRSLATPKFAGNVANFKPKTTAAGGIALFSCDSTAFWY